MCVRVHACRHMHPCIIMSEENTVYSRNLNLALFKACKGHEVQNIQT